METAGFVLVIFPTLVGAIQQYRQILEGCETWWQYRTNFLRFSRSITSQLLIFKDNLEILLSPIVTSDVEMAILLEDPGGPEWKKEDLARRVKQRLPKSYDNYMETVEAMKETLDRLLKEFNIGDGQADESAKKLKTLRTNQRLRLKMVFDYGKLKGLTDELKEQNSILSTLVSFSERLAPTRARNSNDLPAFWQGIRQRASSLYNALTSSWICDCRSSHYINIQLPSVTKLLKPEDELETTEKDPEFKLWFESSGGEETDGLYCHAEVRTIIIRNKAPAILIDVTKVTEVVEVTECNPRPMKARNRPFRSRQQESYGSVSSGLPRKRVQFATDIETNEPQKDFNSELQEIKDLCSILTSNCRQQTCSLGFLGTHGQDYRHELYSAPECFDRYFTGKSWSLYDLLRHQATRCGNEFKLSRKHRTSLAVQISSSLLQFYDTPWICKDWSKADIIFQNLQLSTAPVNVCQPYFRRKCPSPDGDGASDTKEILFRLGVLLLELSTGTSYEERFGKRVGYIPEYAMVYEWWEQDVRDEEWEDYAEAIRKCINFDFPTESRTLRDEDLLKAVYNYVVQPLAEAAGKFRI